MSHTIAVVLSGCGFKDGAEIHESVLTLLALDKRNINYQCFAPDIQQRLVHDHYRDEAVEENRNVLVESARIARCDIQALSEFKAENFDAIIFPGGFGAALNLSSFAIDGPDSNINEEVKQAITTMHHAQKPIGTLCIAPVLIANLLDGVELTIGSNEDVATAIEKMQCQHTITDHTEVVVDNANKIVSSPCYMLDARVSQIAEGADNVVAEVIKLL